MVSFLALRNSPSQVKGKGNLMPAMFATERKSNARDPARVHVITAGRLELCAKFVLGGIGSGRTKNVHLEMRLKRRSLFSVRCEAPTGLLRGTKACTTAIPNLRPKMFRKLFSSIASTSCL